ncbi:MAG: DUF1499 domain-containing protein [Gammaproteobacteria bacterium]|nr:DUF1499 domain-containing protein [Gammaproteobacteria bacterium]MBT8445026.1 DUF1499 domain-containing protein [Gammaproteobacteria bacterium]
MTAASEKRPLGTRWCKTGIALAVIAVILAIVGLGGGRTGLLAGLNAFYAFGLGMLAFMLSVVINLIGLALSKGSAGAASASQAFAALFVGIVALGAAMSQWPESSGPPIHDLTTDVNNPPEFVAVIPQRADAPNPPEYLDNGTAEKQQAAYPNLVTVVYDVPAAEAFAAAEQVAADMGWELVDADLLDGRIEATDSTDWFGFKDDVVIRIGSDGERSFVDVRSKSRVGMGDMGTNAKRIEAFLNALSTKLGA